ncbi:MAG: hypothetical protein EOM21_20055 [Gammaproteobacteria bacterium]|nr:hypothetical protein [Gammaproteobacteria bacterium]
MRDDLIDTLRDCANALGEILPRDHTYRKIVDRANRRLDRHDGASHEQRVTDALRSLMDALPSGTQTSMTVFRPEINSQIVQSVWHEIIMSSREGFRQRADEAFDEFVAEELSDYEYGEASSCPRTS